MDTIKQRLRRFNGTDYDTVHLETDGSVVEVQEEFTSPLNTDQLTLGQTGVYFTAYPSITWQVQHLDGNYAYLALYPMTDTSAFGSGSAYSGSTIASKCTDYLNDTIPNVADYLEDVTVEGVTAKVFIPSYAQLNSEWDWPKAGASNRICQLNGSNNAYWTSSAFQSDPDAIIRYVDTSGGFPMPGAGPSAAYGFRPAVKVQYKAPTKDLNTALNDINIALADSDVFIATYGVTSYSDILAAYNANKFIVVARVLNGSTDYCLTCYTGSAFYFRTFSNSTATNYGCYVDSSSNWSVNSYTYATTSSPTFIGTPKAPTATSGTNTTQIATTAFVQTAISSKESTSNKVTTLSASSTDTQYPSAKAVYDSLQDIDGATVNVETPEEVTNPLNTDQLTLGQTGVYFTAYPDITWQVQHLSGDYAYLALYPMTETSAFGSSSTYSGSTIASKCTTFLNNTIPNVADYLEDVTVNGVTAKVFIPSKAMYETDWDWPKVGASNRICQLNGSNNGYWTSTAISSSYVWIVFDNGDFNYGYPSHTYGFRPAVKVQYKGNVTKDLNTVLNDKQDKLTFDTTPTANSTNPVTSGGVKSYVDASYTIAGQKSGTTLGTKATAEGTNTTASGTSSHAEGNNTTASKTASHAEGYGTTASGDYSHAEGCNTTASGSYCHAEGIGTVASGWGQHVFGSYNSASANYIEIVGNGYAVYDEMGEHIIGQNARTLDNDGNEILAGKLTLGAAPTANMDAATKKYVDDNVNPYVVGTTAPTNTSKLWIDTTATTGGLKYYNGSAWVHVPTAFTS